MLFPLDSAIVVRGENHEDRAVKPGQMIWLADWQRYSVVAPRTASAASASIPAAAVDEYGDPSSFGVIESSPLLEPVRSFLVSLTQAAQPLGALSEYFSEKLVAEMAASLVLESRGLHVVAKPGQSVLDQAMTHISAYRADTSLSPTRIAQALNISVRQLQRAFAAAGTSPGREIRRQRAELALSMLSDRSFRVLSVAQIASHAGFASAADLRRALDQFHHVTPRELRAETPFPRARAG